MMILGIETSCDDTAVALVDEVGRVRSALVSSQTKLHAKFGGVVPEVASRAHLANILPLIDMLLAQAQITPSDISAIAVTSGPGLLGSLLVGVNTARTLSYLWGKPIISVDHLVAHIYGSFVGRGLPKFPVLALVVSGGHTELIFMTSKNSFQYLGGTRDDAAGEAFDKAAKILGLGYPGGPAVAEAAMAGSAGTVKLPRPMMGPGLDMSFSGLKTAVSRADKRNVAAVAYEFQAAVVDVLATKLERAIKKFNPATLVVAGGVSANQALRIRLQALADQRALPLWLPELEYCTDNAAMVALSAYFLGSGAKTKWYNVGVSTQSFLINA